MFFQSRKNKGELRRKLIEVSIQWRGLIQAGVIDEEGRQLLHRFKDEDSWLGERGITKREELSQRIEQKTLVADASAKKAAQDKLELEERNTDRARVGIFDPSKEVLASNLRKTEEMEKVEDETSLDPRVGVFYRDRGEKKGWFEWLWKTGEKQQVEATQAQPKAQPQLYT